MISREQQYFYEKTIFIDHVIQSPRCEHLFLNFRYRILKRSKSKLLVKCTMDLPENERQAHNLHIKSFNLGIRIIEGNIATMTFIEDSFGDAELISKILKTLGEQVYLKEKSDLN